MFKVFEKISLLGKAPIVAALVCFALAFGSCAAPPASPADAAAAASTSASSGAAVAVELRGAGSYFYEGLLRSDAGAEAEALALFERALGDPNSYAAAAAAAELLRRSMTRRTEFSAETWQRIGAAATDSWACAFGVLDAAESADARRAALDLLLSRSTDSAVLHAMWDWHRSHVLAGTVPSGLAFTAAETAAINGRVAASRSRHADALRFFRVAMNQSPGLFFAHPDLLSDLGRAFQFAATDREGIDVFLQWEAIAAAGSGNWRGHPLGAFAGAGGESLIRFQLLFFAGRIERQRGNAGASIAFFERALPFAAEVSAAQSDATIWYILRSAIDESPEAMIRQLERHISLWHNDAGFFEVMDRLSRQLILDWRWDQMARVFNIVRARESAITAKFAWIMARAIQEGYIPQQHVAALGLPAGSAVPALMRVAHDSSGRSLYYRLMSANFLGENFLALPQAAGDSRGPGSNAALFLLGFFENGAEQFALPHIRAMENGLSLGDLRLVSEALASTGNYLQSITMITRFTRRETFDFSQMTRMDWELWYPRPFRDLIEGNAARVGIEPHLMLALVRAESAFMPSIVSHAGAIGLTQLMPATAVETAARIQRQGGPDFRLARGGVGGTNLNLNDPAVNVYIGTTYLGILNERVGDPMLALLAYNAGTGRVRSWLNGNLQALGFELPIDIFLETVPFPETRNYGRNVTAAAEVYRQLYFAGGVAAAATSR